MINNLKIFTLPNLLSLSRLPLSFAFLNEQMSVRIGAIILALLSDGLDGYFARRNNARTALGTLLDPLMDKFFVLFAMIVMVNEFPMELWQVCAMFCRDFSIILFGIYLTLKGQLFHYKPRAIWCGKVSTVLQMVVLICLTLQLAIPNYIYYTFIILGISALGELAFNRQKWKVMSNE